MRRDPVTPGCTVCTADRWAHRLIGFLAGLLVAGLLWGVVVDAASRSAVHPGVSVPSWTDAGGRRTGAPHEDSRARPISGQDRSAGKLGGAPQPTATVDGPPAPSAKPRRTKVGIASYYDDGPGIYAAMHAYRWGMTPYPVVVCAFDGGRSTCITVHVVDHCYCRVGGSTRLIDLSPAAFAQLAPLSRGLVKVSVEVLR